MTISSSPGGGGVKGVCLPGITQAGQVDVALVVVMVSPHYQDSGVSIDEHNDNDINLVTMAPW